MFDLYFSNAEISNLVRCQAVELRQSRLVQFSAIRTSNRESGEALPSHQDQYGIAQNHSDASTGQNQHTLTKFGGE